MIYIAAATKSATDTTLYLAKIEADDDLSACILAEEYFDSKGITGNCTAQPETSLPLFDKDSSCTRENDNTNT